MRNRIHACLVLLMAASLAPARAQAGGWYLEAGAGRLSGDFGTADTGRVDLAYGTVGYAWSRAYLDVTVPALRLETRSSGGSRRASGLGDVLVRGLRRVVAEPGGFSFDAGLAVKFPTADPDADLGTGQGDAEAFLALNQRWGRFQVTVQGGWIQSQPRPGQRNGQYTAGCGMAWYASRTKVSLGYAARAAPYPGTPSPRELALDVYRALGTRFALRASWAAGLSDGSPHSNLGVGLLYFP
ncbi:hypothetical protein [Mesoterricola silvestris]|uniref:Cellulose biosynthesis protein BcsS n=1 Tax=Mesoterricola silvestris TaxID=2927979 RepID=A0AA48GWY8_9BACT|nr:hypothetical protein [Mesoterricola silvestris]BDU71863.1 hypothetical protein METEAL_10370 [Mesoterricola silvestris]